MRIQIESISTGTPTMAENLEVGTRVLIGVDTKKILSVSINGDAVSVKASAAYGKVAYYKFPADRTMFVY